jgi:hypothetical protein
LNRVESERKRLLLMVQTDNPLIKLDLDLFEVWRV